MAGGTGVGKKIKYLSHSCLKFQLLDKIYAKAARFFNLAEDNFFFLMFHNPKFVLEINFVQNLSLH